MLRLAALALALALLAAIWSPGLLAQTRMAVSSMRPAPTARPPAPTGTTGQGQRASTVIMGGRAGHHHRFARSPFFYGDPYFYSDFYEPYEAEYARPEPVVQPAPAPPEPVKSEPIPDPVLLELRGNDWVRVTSFSNLMPAAENNVVESGKKFEAQRNMPPALLVYRDGHSEEVGSYSIIAGVIYAKSDYWSSGAWTKNIPIADLDIPATLRENQQRGVKFELPSGPNEVMIRP